MKIGLELEFWVTDSEGKLDIAKPVSDRVYFTSQEFSKSMIEIQTEPHENLSDLFQELISKTEILSELAKKDDRRIVPLGTPLNSGEVNLYESERFRIEKKILGPEVKHAGRAAGLHIHFEKENVINQLNSLIALDPALAAINSSPYYNGKPVANGSRNKVYRYRSCGPFPEQRQLWEYAESKEGWREKRQKLFEKFQEKAVEKGVARERLKEYFTPEDSVWTPVRLREDYPTTEWRAPDASLLTEVIKLVQEVSPIIRNNELAEDLPEFERVDGTSDQAMEKGLKSDRVRKYLEEINVDHTRFRPLSQQLPEKNNLSRKEAQKLRLETSRKLSEDLENAKEMVK